MTIFYCPETGEILSSAEHDMAERDITNMLALLPNGTKAMPGHFPVGLGYVVQGTVCQKPDKPGDEYVWGSAVKAWHKDPVLSAALVRRTRTALLQKSDWTQLPDVPSETKDQWAKYRQLLRDITDQAGFPESVIWPNKPE